MSDLLQETVRVFKSSAAKQPMTVQEVSAELRDKEHDWSVTDDLVLAKMRSLDELQEVDGKRRLKA